MKNFAAFLASGFFLSHPVYALTAGRTRWWRGCGLIGSAQGMLACWLWGYFSEPTIAAVFAVLGFITFISIPIATAAEDYYGSTDDSRIVIDEFVGYAWAGVWWMHSIPALGAAFIIFRVLDVSKPLGIRKLEALPGGWGCILDDVASGMLSALLIGLWQWFF